MKRDPSSAEFHDRALPDRFCDLILTGGVTSAIAYPGVILTLASVYRFNAIGGSSSGAGTAALAAAAEYRRRHGSSEGYRVLLDRVLEVKELHGKDTKLRRLFQPEPKLARLLKALLPAMALPDHKLLRLLGGLLGRYVAGPFALLFAALVAWLHFSREWRPLDALAAGFAPALLAALGAGVVVLWLDLRRLVRHDFGLCSGLSIDDPRAGAPPALTDWLHRLIQEIAGRSEGEAPLTFADLEAAPGAPSVALADPTAAGRRSIVLQMFTSNLTHGRPYRLPQEDNDPPLFFKPREMRELFPCDVVKHLLGRAAQGDRAALDEDALLPLPRRELPIVVAARMSVSFPVLFRAVPLWVASASARQGTAAFERCLFVDGGLCSNFPIHLFDSAVPPWPTFGVALREMPAEQPPAPRRCEPRPPPPWDPSSSARAEDFVHFAAAHDGLRPERITAAAVRAPRPQRRARDLMDFVAALIATTKDWNDAALAGLPGVRDRIVEVHLPPGIGGLNLLMKPPQIRFLAELGEAAGRRLLERFAEPSDTSGLAEAWNRHRRERFLIFADALARTLGGLGWSASRSSYALPLRQMLRDTTSASPSPIDSSAVASAPALTVAQAAALEGALDALLRAEKALNAPAEPPRWQPQPRPDFRIRPPL